MYCVLSGRESLLRPGHFPDWVNLSCLMTLIGDRDVERHYHHYEEVWLWREGTARVWSEGMEFEIQPGQLSYTPDQRQHSFEAMGAHVMTLIVPKIPPTTSWGHLHLDETREILQPQWDSQLLMAKQTSLESGYEFPVTAFARQIIAGSCAYEFIISYAQTEAWFAVLIESGSLSGFVDAEMIELQAGQCLCVSKGVYCELRATAKANLTIVHGWPDFNTAA